MQMLLRQCKKRFTKEIMIVAAPCYDENLKINMLWPSQNFLLHKSTILIKYFISNFLIFYSIEAEIRLSRVMRKKKIKSGSK